MSRIAYFALATTLVFALAVGATRAHADDKPSGSGDPATCPDQNTCDTVAYEREHREPPDVRGALVAKERACTFGEKYACYEAANAWRDGVAGAKVLALDERASTLGNRDGCVDAGVGYLIATGAAKNTTKALALMTKGCDAGAMNGCKNLAFI